MVITSNIKALQTTSGNWRFYVVMPTGCWRWVRRVNASNVHRYQADTGEWCYSIVLPDGRVELVATADGERAWNEATSAAATMNALFSAFVARQVQQSVAPKVRQAIGAVTKSNPDGRLSGRSVLSTRASNTATALFS